MQNTSQRSSDHKILSEKLIEKAKNGESKAIKSVTAYCKKYICSAIKKATERDDNTKIAEDVYDDRFLIVWGCLQSYEPSKKALFSSWVYSNVLWECSKRLNKRDGRSRMIKKLEDDPTTRFYDNSLESIESEEEKIHHMNQINKKCTNIEKKILTERFFKGKIQGFQQIGRSIGKDRRSAKKLYLKILNKLNKELYE